MKSYEFKKILNSIDKRETSVTTLEQLKQVLLNDDELPFSEQTLSQLIMYLYEQHFLVHATTLELKAPLTLFARAKQNSLCEAICLFESLLVDDEVQLFFKKYQNQSFSKKMIEKAFHNHAFIYNSLFTSKIFIQLNNKYVFNEEIIKATPYILQELQEPAYIISTICYTHYIESLIDYQDLELRNTDKELINYPNISYIFNYLPQMGIPVNRSLSEGLQNFYKDTLMQEFRGQCPICGIHIPHLLIASHIKPFRDCSHMIESSDHCNGILLCKNHDFLFDQGYISFDEQGQIIISKEIKKEDLKALNLTASYQLPKHLLTPRRKQFLAYHRKTYFKGETHENN